MMKIFSLIKARKKKNSNSNNNSKLNVKTIRAIRTLTETNIYIPQRYNRSDKIYQWLKNLASNSSKSLITL